MNRLKKEVSIDILKDFSQALAKLKSGKEINIFLSEVLTCAEGQTLSLRWQLLKMLKEGRTQRDIAKELNISLCKITRGSRLMRKKGTVTKRIL